MRIILTNPYCWPYVRRGSERFIAEYAAYLSERGHDVVTLSSKPGVTTIEETPAGKRVLLRQWWTPRLSKLRIQPTHGFALGTFLELRNRDADFVHSLYFMDAVAAQTALGKRSRMVYQVTGPPLPQSFPRVPPDRALLARAIRNADRLLVHSEFTRCVLQQYHFRDAEVIPVPICFDAFPAGTGPPDGRPAILSVADFNEPRKGLKVLVQAFALLRKRGVNAVLRLSGQLNPAARSQVIDPLPPSVRNAIELLGTGSVSDLPKIYGSASITVLPSMWEAYGMVIIESWACGTPVVVTRHGGLAELVTEPALGITFDPLTESQVTTNSEGLATAMQDGLALALRPEARARCRAHAATFDWKILGPRYESLYAAV